VRRGLVWGGWGLGFALENQEGVKGAILRNRGKRAVAICYDEPAESWTGGGELPLGEAGS